MGKITIAMNKYHALFDAAFERIQKHL